MRKLIYLWGLLLLATFVLVGVPGSTPCTTPRSLEDLNTKHTMVIRQFVNFGIIDALAPEGVIACINIMMIEGYP